MQSDTTKIRIGGGDNFIVVYILFCGLFVMDGLLVLDRAVSARRAWRVRFPSSALVCFMHSPWWNGRMVKATVCKTVCAGSIPASTSAERLSIVVTLMLHADVAQLVAHNLAMVGVASSIPVIRSGERYDLQIVSEVTKRVEETS